MSRTPPNFRLGLLLLLLLCSAPALFAQTESSVEPPVQRCVNLGNMLESPNEGEWGLRVQEFYLQTIADAGFDTVRIPIKWSNHADPMPPYTLDADFLARVDQVVGWALAADLQVILDLHPYDEMATDPEGHIDRLAGLWEQIAAHYADLPETVAFEAMNEPNGALTPALWNRFFPQVLERIRRSNPDRLVIVGGGNWNSLDSLATLELPDDDHLMATFHYYLPFNFTHQGAEWVNGMDAYLGTPWGSPSEKAEMQRHFATAAAWSAENGVPLLLGEFGVYSRADLDARLLWTAAVRESAEANGIAWCYWEFGAGFGLYDVSRREYNAIYGALMPDQT
ncbi:MAG: glycoside hydrolase family 5 protein [Chloroflexi bacterium]|nr:glycoside hydrolase family 5 protein [Chloroflexota bacterium]